MAHDPAARRTVVLAIGQNKSPERFRQSMQVYAQHAQIMRVFLVVWATTDSSSLAFATALHPKISVVKVPPEQFAINPQYQHHLYHVGLQHIQDHVEDPENLYVLKTRLDVLLSPEQVSFVCAQNYAKSEDAAPSSFQYKIWLPWVHLIVPLYMEDACFYSHMSVMRQLLPTESLQAPHDIQGHSHFRWFLALGRAYNLYPGLETCPSFASFCAQHPEYCGLLGRFSLEKEPARAALLQAYWQMLHDNCIICTVPGGIQFRAWSSVTYYSPPSTTVQDIIATPAPSNLKIAYTNAVIEALSTNRS